MESIKIFRFKTFRVGYIDKKLSSSSLFIIYMLKIVFCIEYFSRIYLYSVQNILFDLTSVEKTPPRFIAPRESFAVEFAVIKHFGRESLHVEPSWGLDVVEYMLKCVFC